MTTDIRKSLLKQHLPSTMPRPPPDSLSLSATTTSTLFEDDELPDIPPSPVTDDSSSASSASSTGTIKPLFPRPQTRAKPSLDPIPWSYYFSESLTLDGGHHIYLTRPTPSGPLFITHHGAGSSGLSFALLASEIRKLLPSAGVLSIDARGHGETTIGMEDLTLPALAGDLIGVVQKTKEYAGWEKLPDLVLVGHSLGGAVVTEVANGGKLGAAVVGFAVVDVVEGSAMEALMSMRTYLESRPAGFRSLRDGIEWHTRTRTLRNPLSARISVPALLAPSSSPYPYTWRTSLSDTQPFWSSWFMGLSSKFLTSKPGKLLILAGTDRLDKELMIGQMQGKYQLIVVPECGHFVQEDAPEKMAGALVEFYRRNDRSALVLPPKVGDILAMKKKEAEMREAKKKEAETGEGML